MAHFLERAGASVTLAQNGQIGFDKALAARDANRPFDGILIDIVMPIMDGYTAVLALRASGIRTPILAVTALAMPRDRQRCLDAGCDDYITKPLDRRRFVSLVAQHVVRRSGEECVL
jgi:CheY-like chemotaxis protein